MQMEKPVKEGQTYELRCVGQGKRGDGICKHDGFVVIVPKATLGKTYQVKVERVRASCAFGQIVG